MASNNVYATKFTGKYEKITRKKLSDTLTCLPFKTLLFFLSVHDKRKNGFTIHNNKTVCTKGGNFEPNSALTPLCKFERNLIYISTLSGYPLHGKIVSSLPKPPNRGFMPLSPTPNQRSARSTSLYSQNGFSTRYYSHLPNSDHFFYHDFGRHHKRELFNGRGNVASRTGSM